MEYEIVISRSAEKNIRKLAEKERLVLARLLMDLRESGPMQPKYSNFSKLGRDKYHCHLSYHWVACWQSEKGQLRIEVYYVGSRESAPY